MICSLGLLGNTVIMVVLIRKKKTVFDYSILCLSLADGMFSLIMAAAISISISNHAVLVEEILRAILLGVDIYSINTVFLLTVFIPIQRFIAVLFPLKCRRILTKKKCIAVLISIWITSAILTPLALSNNLSTVWISYIHSFSCLVGGLRCCMLQLIRKNTSCLILQLS